MSRGRSKSSPIHLPECRDRFLDELRAGTKRIAAAESIGCVWKTVKRYIDDHPEFELKLLEAEAGRPTVSESAEPAPVVVARIVHEAEPVDAEPCDVAKVRPAPADVTGLDAYRDRLMTSIERVVDDPDHPHFARVADMLFKAIYGPSLLRAMRQAERESELLDVGDKRQRIVVVRVPVKAAP